MLAQKNATYYVLLLLWFAACSQPDDNKQVSEAYDQRLATWKTEREAELKGENGWLNLVGLYWLKDGINTVGSDTLSDIDFPAGMCPARLGTIMVANGEVHWKTEAGQSVLWEGNPVSDAMLKGQDGEKTLSFGSLKWFVIERGGRFAVRLRNLQHPDIAKFKGLSYYPKSDRWLKVARVEKLANPIPIRLPNIIGIVDTIFCSTSIVFEDNGVEYKLYPVDEEKNSFFVVFGDKTNQTDTYGGGRFVYVDKPEPGSDLTLLDFNKSHNPPCSFTSFATCPLPPRENKLPLTIEAGEKNYEDETHVQ